MKARVRSRLDTRLGIQSDKSRTNKTKSVKINRTQVVDGIHVIPELNRKKQACQCDQVEAAQLLLHSKQIML